MINNVADLQKLAPEEAQDELFFGWGSCTVCSTTCSKTALPS